MTDTKNLLFCGAFEGEVDLLIRNNFPVLVSGVGISESIFQLQKYIYDKKSTPEIIFCGSCGSYDIEKHTIGEIVYSNTFIYQEIAESYGIVKVPDLIQKNIQTDSSIKIKNFIKSQNLKAGITNSTNSITIQTIEKKYISNLENLNFENMESFGLAFVAKKLDLKFTAFFSVTNFVGENGSFEWHKNWRVSSNTLQSLILENFY
ncbi:MAG: hypothetical protein L6Q54_08350 [Leptospiraceae bacterium]|nr:hypothetical protein [Leptospiraceae bacterium]MCK6381245.1 hypothetical protein [Leptospiraceae bacterium]NUM42334.1 hypothetical protein [Leptospiraceae bacterium]